MDIRDIVWDEDGEMHCHQLYSSDVTIEDVPKLIQEHRDLRRALHATVELLKKMDYNPNNPRSRHEWDIINELKRKLII